MTIKLLVRHNEHSNEFVCFLRATVVVFFVSLTLKTTRSCWPSCRTVPSSFIRRTKAMAKFFSLLSLADDEETERQEGGKKHIRETDTGTEIRDERRKDY